MLTKQYLLCNRHVIYEGGHVSGCMLDHWHLAGGSSNHV